MRAYLARLDISDITQKTTGEIGEIVFEKWFNNSYQGEQLHSQNLDRDYQGIDFACGKGFTYQVKATRNRTYTFNCVLDDAREHLKADVYVLVQVKDSIAYIEGMYSAEDLKPLLIKSYNNNNCFLYAKNLLQTSLYEV